MRDVEVSLHHVLRAQNSLAGRIAKWSVGQDQMFIGDCLLECLM